MDHQTRQQESPPTRLLTSKREHQTELPQIGFWFHFSTFQKENESYQQSISQIIWLCPKWIVFQNGPSNSHSPYRILIPFLNTPKGERIISVSISQIIWQFPKWSDFQNGPSNSYSPYWILIPFLNIPKREWIIPTIQRSNRLAISKMDRLPQKDHQTYLPHIGFGFYFSNFQRKKESYQQYSCRIVWLCPKWIVFQNGPSNLYTPYWIWILLFNFPKEEWIISTIQMSNSSAISKMDRLPKWIIKLLLYPILNSDSTSQHPKGTKNRISNTAVE